MNERERRLDVGLLQSGKFAEALAGLDKWLADTEDMVRNQKPPSADYKVVKAQLQEQKVRCGWGGRPKSTNRINSFPYIIR